MAYPDDARSILPRALVRGATVSLAAALALATGCTCAESHQPDDAATPDAHVSTHDTGPIGDDGGPRVDTGVTRPDAGGLCTSRSLRAMRIDEFALLDPIEPHAGRSFRIRARYTQPDGCHSRAMTRVEIDEERFVVDVTVRDWVIAGVACTEATREDARLITLRLPSGEWTIRDAREGGTLEYPLRVGPGIRSPCTPGRDSCLQDCDCTGDARCLYAMSPSGPWGYCALPCEEDLDCRDPNAVCAIEAVGGPLSVCSSSPGPCGGVTCPAGYACDAGRCTPTFRLSATTRHACACDAECDPGLACVVGASGSRCEVACPSGGAFCEGLHACGSVDALAVSDAVCGFLGE